MYIFNWHSTMHLKFVTLSPIIFFGQRYVFYVLKLCSMFVGPTLSQFTNVQTKIFSVSSFIQLKSPQPTWSYFPHPPHKTKLKSSSINPQAKSRGCINPKRHKLKGPPAKKDGHSFIVHQKHRRIYKTCSQLRPC